MLNKPTHLTRPQRQTSMRVEDRLSESLRCESNDSPCCSALNELNAERETILLDLIAMAKPVKVKGEAEQLLKLVLTKCVPKGLAKEFEVVPKVKQVIVLEDSISELRFCEDWEELEYNRETRERTSYSAALRRSGSGEGHESCS